MQKQLDLQTEIYKHLDPLVCEISLQFGINYNELKKFINGEKPNNPVNFSKVCLHKMISGKNKGQICGKNAVANGYCSKHQATFLKSGFLLNGNSGGGGSGSGGSGAGASSGGSSNSNVGKMTKTEQTVQEWLGTAVPSAETVLVKQSDGNLFHEGTELVFNSEYFVIGRLSKTGLDKISHYEVELCERHGWKYLRDIVEPDPEESSISGSGSGSASASASAS